MSWFECKKCVEKDDQINKLEVDLDYWREVDKKRQRVADWNIQAELTQAIKRCNETKNLLEQSNQEINLLKREIETLKACNVELRLAMEALGKYR